MTKRKTILLTGGTGFIGGALAEHWVAEGHRVLLPVTNPEKLSSMIATSKNAMILHCDLECPSNSYKEAVLNEKPEVFCHTAWRGSSANERDNYEVQWRQVVAFNELLLLASNAKTSQFINLGSQAECNPSATPLNDESPINPQSPYGAAKAACGLLGAQWAKLNKILFTHLRLLTVYGPGDASQRLIPYLFRSSLNGTVPQLSPGEQVWDYLYIDDLVRLMDNLIERRVDGTVLAASGEALALKDVAAKISQLQGTSVEIGARPYRSNELMFLQGAPSKAFSEAHWRPAVPFALGIEKTAKWWTSKNLA